jgi:hypothetical protein
VGGRDVDQLGRWSAAVLACGPDALLSHQSAAALWRIRPPRPGPIEVSVPAEVRRRPGSIRVHRRSGLSPIDRGIRLGISVTSPIRTLVDLCGILEAAQLEAAVNEADKLDLVDPVRLRQALDQMRGQPGAGALKRLLDRPAFRLTDSELERRFLRLVRSARLPQPETGQNVEGFRVDFFWRELGLVVERPTACATTARRLSRRGIAAGISCTPRSDSRRCASPTPKSGTSRRRYATCWCEC